MSRTKAVTTWNIPVESIPRAARRAAAETTSWWDKHADLLALYLRMWPEVADDIARCRRKYKGRIDADKEDRGMVKPVYACHKYPWCVPCVRKDNGRRAFKNLDVFARASPPDDGLRLLFGTATAPLTEDGEGVGRFAAAQPKRFRRLVIEWVKDVFGDDIAVLATYQHYGERPLRKVHPHVHFLLNGYGLRTGRIRRIRAPDYSKANRPRLLGALVKWYRVLDLEARPGNIDFQFWKTGVASAFKMLRYQLRHMPSMERVSYRPDRDEVLYHKYRERKPVSFRPVEFAHAFEDYRTWSRSHGGGKRFERSAYYVYLADAARNAAHETIGGNPISSADEVDWREPTPEDWERMEGVELAEEVLIR